MNYELKLDSYEIGTLLDAIDFYNKFCLNKKDENFSLPAEDVFALRSKTLIDIKCQLLGIDK